MSGDSRQPYLDAILGSDSRKMLIAAGPGTGKTTAFRAFLELHRGTNRVLTFINALVDDLETSLGDIALVSTFHSYCASLLHQLNVEGITTGVDYYPPIGELFPSDVSAVTGRDVTKAQLNSALHLLDDSQGLLSSVLRCGAYYDAVGHDDAVLRVVNHLGSNPQLLPRMESLVVDEVQDFNPLEVALIEILSTEARVLLAGDDDQALYGFKQASPEYIREVADRPDFATFNLPYCSRCTEVIVAAVASVIQRATAKGILSGRLDKPFECYLPTKGADSAAHPKITNAICSVSNAHAPYMGRYVQQQIEKISASDREEALKEGYPVALVVGPPQFLGECEAVLRAWGGCAISARYGGSQLSVPLLDGYRKLLANPRSRLGWRIVLHNDPVQGLAAVLGKAHLSGQELADLLPGPYRILHLERVRTLALLSTQQPVDDETLKDLVDALEMDLVAIQQKLGVFPEPEVAPPDSSLPSVVITTLTGAKGLSAGHVFMVGMVNEHFPRVPAAPTFTEVCQLLVGLTRTRKQCHLVSARRFGAKTCEPSSLISWLTPHIQLVKVDKAYWSS
jgi:superfamily I DNA/RNA helicase